MASPHVRLHLPCVLVQPVDACYHHLELFRLNLVGDHVSARPAMQCAARFHLCIYTSCTIDAMHPAWRQGRQMVHASSIRASAAYCFMYPAVGMYHGTSALTIKTSSDLGHLLRIAIREKRKESATVAMDVRRPGSEMLGMVRSILLVDYCGDRSAIKSIDPNIPSFLEQEIILVAV